MPELPEVEVSRLGLLLHLPGKRIVQAVFRVPRLRHDIPAELPGRLAGLPVSAIHRRGKYLLFDCASEHDGGWLILHLGMSGSLRVLPGDTPVRAHDHVDISLDNGQIVRRLPNLCASRAVFHFEHA